MPMTAKLMLALQVSAFAFALLGTWLLRKPGRWWPWAFVAWLVSNPMAMVFMALQGHWWFVAQHLLFLLLAIESTWNWLIAPRIVSRGSLRRASPVLPEHAGCGCAGGGRACGHRSGVSLGALNEPAPQFALNQPPGDDS